MHTFQTFLESLGSELPYRIKRRDSEYLVAVVDDVDGAYWQIIFKRWEMMDGNQHRLVVAFEYSKSEYNRPAERKPTTTALKLYSTVGRLIQTYIKDFPVNEIVFSPSEQKMIPTYERLSKRIAKAVNGKAELIGAGNSARFVVTVGDKRHH